MTQHFPLDYGNIVHEGFFDPIQELLGTYTGLRIYVVNSTTLGITAGTGNSQVAVTINNAGATSAGFRYISSNITAALPGGLTNGTGSVYVTASANSFGGALSDPDAATNYSFSLEILASGNPSASLYRKVGEVDVSSSAIKAFRPMAGPRPTGEFPITAVADHPTQNALLVRGAASQTAPLIDVQNSSGTSQLTIGPSGAITSASGLTISSTDGLTISADGGNDTINLSNTASGVGITIGGDTTIYRQAANELRTDDKLSVKRLATESAFATQVGTETNNRLNITGNGQLSIGNGTNAADTYLYRKSSGGWQIDSNGSNGATSLSLYGTLSVSGNVAFNGATPTSPNSWSITNSSLGSARTFDANNVTINQLADICAALAQDMKNAGLVSGTIA